MKSKSIIIAAIAAVIIVGGVAFAIWYSTRPATATDAARAYLTALQTRDADGVRAAIADPDAYPESAYAALSSATASVAWDDAAITITEEDASASGSAAISVDGDTFTLPIDLTRDGATWKVDARPADDVTLTVNESAGFALGDQTLQAPDGTSEPMRFFPGAYTARALPADFVSGEVTFVAGIAGASAPGELTGHLRAEAAEPIHDAITAHLDECVQPASAVAEACGFTVPWTAEFEQLRDVTYRVDAQPEIEVDTANGSFTTTLPGALVATGSGVLRGGAEAELSYRTDAWAPRGVVRIAETGIEVRVF